MPISGFSDSAGVTVQNSHHTETRHSPSDLPLSQASDFGAFAPPFRTTLF